MWVALNGCEQNTHVFKRVDGKIVCVHSDDSICEEAEYDITDRDEL